MNSNLVFRDVVDPIGYVRRLACQVTSMYPHCVHLDDLIGQGLVALVRCQRRFDARRGTRFATYAWSRVRFAMVDLVRAEAKRRMFLRPEDFPEFPTETTIEELVVEHDQVGHFHRAVDRLPLRQKTFVRELLKGDTEVDACRRLGITRGAARELRLRAFTSLRRELGADFGAQATAA